MRVCCSWQPRTRKKPLDSLPWLEVLGEEIAEPDFAALLRFVGDERQRHKGKVYPRHWNMFEAFHQTPYEEVRVVILGRDPYPNPEKAMGLAFSVPKGVSKPTSLLSIDKALVMTASTRSQAVTSLGGQRKGCSC